MDVLKKAKRLQCYSQKIILVLEITDLILPLKIILQGSWGENARLSFCLEKGGKLASTEEISISRPTLFQLPAIEGNVSIPLARGSPKGMTMELPLTIYRDKKQDVIQEKHCQIVLRRRTIESNKPDTYVGISKSTIKLQEFLGLMDYSSNSFDRKVFSLDFTQGIRAQISLQVFLVPTLQPQQDGRINHLSLVEENMSMISDMTEISALGAIFPISHKQNSCSKEDLESPSAKLDDNPSEKELVETGNYKINQEKRGELCSVQELKDLRIEELEAELHQMRVTTEMEKASMLSQINELQAKISNEEYARQLLTELTDRTDKELAKGLCEAREKIREHQRASEQATLELQTLKEDVIYYQKLLDRMRKEREEERRAVGEATELIAQAKMQNAVLQDENDHLISQLIEVKIQLANIVLDREAEQKKIFTLRKAIQIYAEQTALLELKLLHVDGKVKNESLKNEKEFQKIDTGFAQPGPSCL